MQYSKVLALGAAILCLRGDPKVEETGGVPVPGGVVDASSKIAYLGDLERGIVAIDPSDGELRWESPEATRPLALHQGRLMALKVTSASFSIAVLDAGTGRLIRESAEVRMRSFAPITGVRTNAWVTEKTLHVRWLAEQMALGGACPKEALLSPDERGSAGIVLMDIDTAELETPSGEGMPLSFPLEGSVLVEDLPVGVRDVARSERWEFGVVVGEQVYGRCRSPIVKSAAGSSTQTQDVHVFDLATDKVVWRSSYETRVLPSLDSIRQP